MNDIATMRKYSTGSNNNVGVWLESNSNLSRCHTISVVFRSNFRTLDS